MLKKIYLVVVISFFSFVVSAQVDNEYADWIKKAMDFYNAKQYKQCGDAYTHAFAALGGNGHVDDRYNAACVWSLSGNKDSAFYHLNILATKANYKDLNQLLIDADLYSLQKDKRWKILLALVKQNKEAAEVNKQLVAILDTISQNDQRGRNQLVDIERKYGYNAKEGQEIWKIIYKDDSINLQKIEKILDVYGWLGTDVVGDDGNLTIFLVIQHADVKVQEKYLPMMRDAVKNKKARQLTLPI